MLLAAPGAVGPHEDLADGVVPEVPVEADGVFRGAAGIDGGGQDGFDQPEGGITQEIVGCQDLYGPGPGGERVADNGGSRDNPLDGVGGEAGTGDLVGVVVEELHEQVVFIPDVVVDGGRGRPDLGS